MNTRLFKPGDKVIDLNQGDEGIITNVREGGGLDVDWLTGYCKGFNRWIEPESCKLVEPEQVVQTVEFCLKFLTEQGFSVTLTKG